MKKLIVAIATTAAVAGTMVPAADAGPIRGIPIPPHRVCVQWRVIHGIVLPGHPWRVCVRWIVVPTPWHPGPFGTRA